MNTGARRAAGLVVGLSMVLFAGQASAENLLTAATGTVLAGPRFFEDGTTTHTGYGSYDDHAAYDMYRSQSSASLSTITPFVSAYGTGAACLCGATAGGGEGGAYLAYSFEFTGSSISIDPRFLTDNPDVSLMLSPGVLNAEPSLGGRVPEPASWALMLLGFGLGGAGLRTRRAPRTIAT